MVAMCLIRRHGDVNGSVKSVAAVRGSPDGMRARDGPRLWRKTFVQTPRLLLRSNAQLALEQIRTEVVLPERGGAPTELVVELHQRPMHRLAQRLDGEESDGRLNCGLEIGGRDLDRKKLPQNVKSPLPQTGALRPQPILEWRLAQRESHQQVTGVEGRSALKGLARAPVRQLLEHGHVHLYPIRVQRETVALGQERRRLSIGQRPTQLDQSLPEAVPGLLRRHVTPEQGHERFAWTDEARAKSKVGEQSPRLPAREDESLSRAQAGFKPAEES